MLVTALLVSTGFLVIADSTVAPTPIGLGTIETYQSRPDRPLVVQHQRPELFGGLEMSIDNEQDSLRFLHTSVLPGGINFGLYDLLEVGGELDLRIQPEVGADFSVRARVTPFTTKIVGFGLVMTMPLGYLTTHLGPNSMPVAVELPVVRLENIYSALQFSLRPIFNFRSGGVDTALNPAAAGIMRIDHEQFVVLDLAASLAKFDPRKAQVPVGVSYCYIYNKEWTVKGGIMTPDAGTLNDWLVVASVVNLWPLAPQANEPAKSLPVEPPADEPAK
jgi:hypothetical protein